MPLSYARRPNAQLTPLLNAIYFGVYAIVAGDHDASVRSAIETAINKSLPTTTDTQALFLAGSTTRKDELLVSLALQSPSITIQVPYDAFDMPRAGTPVPPER